jgi:hypothetical protein
MFVEDAFDLLLFEQEFFELVLVPAAGLDDLYISLVELHFHLFQHIVEILYACMGIDVLLEMLTIWSAF